MLLNTTDRYGWVARLLHWLIFILAAGMICGGMLLSLLPSGAIRSFTISGHKSVGVIILFLMLVRIVWRNTNPSPHPLSANPLFNYIAHLLHVVLYILLVLQPLSGILMSQAYGYPVVVFGLFTVPQLIWQSPSLGSFLIQAHAATAAILTTAVALHAAAALKHHYVDGDRTLMRMLKGR